MLFLGDKKAATGVMLGLICVATRLTQFLVVNIADAFLLLTKKEGLT